MEEKRSGNTAEKSEQEATSYYLTGGSAGSGSYDPRALWQKLWLGRWKILASALAGALIGLMVAAGRVPLYRVQAVIEARGPARAASGTNPGAPNQAAAEDRYIDTQCRIIESRALVERTLIRLSEGERIRLVESPHFSSKKMFGQRDIDSVQRHISAKPSEQPGIIEVSFLSPDPGAGVTFLNWLTQELADVNVERAWHEAQRNRQWTDRQLSDLQEKWEESEQQALEYARMYGLNVSRQEAGATPDESSALRRQQRSSTASVGNDSKLQQLRAHLADVNKQLAQWEALYGKSDPNIAKLNAEAANTESAIRQRISTLARTRAAAPSSSTASPEGNASGASITPSPEANNRLEEIAHLDALKTEADANRRLYESETKRLREADVANASNIGVIDVVDAASATPKPVTAGRLFYGGWGALAGLVLGALYAGLRERLSHTFSDPGLLAEYLNLGVLGLIPTDKKLGFALPSDSSDEARLDLSYGNDPQIAEAYRSLRSSILLKSNYRTGPKRLLVTSAGRLEGKTAVVGNLGAALASAQRRVLLVDGDLRNPTLHHIFGTQNEHGLSDLLSRQLSEHPVASRDVIRETPIPDLYLLPAGQAGTRAPEILSSVQLPQLIKEFSRAFDFVLIDSPPILPYSDARSLARAADAVILVVKARTTNRRSALLARDTIVQDGTPVMGTILTDWNAPPVAFGTS